MSDAFSDNIYGKAHGTKESCLSTRIRTEDERATENAFAGHFMDMARMTRHLTGRHTEFNPILNGSEVFRYESYQHSFHLES